MRRCTYTTAVVMSFLTLAALVLPGSNACAAETLKVGWSIYPGWMDNALMDMKLRRGKATFLAERCQEHGVQVDVVKFKEYIPSVEALAAGRLDACTMTLGEAFGIPTDSGVPVTCILINDYSNGNDAICVPKGRTWADLEGKSIMAEEFSVSQYLVWRGLQLQGLPLHYLTFKHTPGDDCAKVFISGVDRGQNVTVATWNPHVLRIMATGKADLLFTSEKIPREIVDMVVIRNDRIRGREKAIQAYIAAHYDVMRYFTDANTRDRATRAMTVASELKKADAPLFKSMLAATRFYTTPEETATFMESAELKKQHDRVREFLKVFGAFKGKAPDTYQVRFDSSYVRQVK